jgi:preprotein translocase subunit SecG
MLSFMREQGAGNLPGNQGTGSGQQGTGTSNHADSQEYLTVAANSKNLRRSTILVMILVAIGLACLGYMIRKSRPQAASAQPADDESKIEVAISRLTGVSSEMLSRMDEIVTRFYEFSDVFQVGVGELVKNPFEVEAFAGALKDDVSKPDDEKAKAALIQRERLKQRANALKLLSVMRSDRGNCCMINDRILQQGDVIEGFMITRIMGDSVELTAQSDGGAGPVGEAEALKIELKLSQ